MRRPPNIIYWLNDLPPARVGFAMALQQVAFLVALLGIPGLASTWLGAGHAVFLDLAGATLLAAGFCVILQGLGRFGLGAGLFYPLQCTTATLPALLFASRHSGPEAAFGMIAVIGLTQLGVSLCIHRLRGIFTVEVAGLAVFLIGVGLGENGLILIGGKLSGEGIALLHLLVAFVTFGVLVGCHVYLRSRLRLFTPLMGLTVGFLLSWAFGLLDGEDLALMDDAPLIGVPSLPAFGWAFDLSSLVPYVITGITLALTSLGVQVMAQRANDADWQRPDLARISRGIRAEGVTHLLGSVLNALPMVASGGAVALATASGCTSRALAWWTGGLLLLLAFLPKLLGLWLLLPESVTGALFLFLSAITTMTGLSLIGSRLLDNRKTIALGVGFVTAIAYEPLSNLLAQRAPELHLLTFSGFALSILVTLSLLALFRLGAKEPGVHLLPGEPGAHNAVVEFLQAQGRRWGADRAAIGQAAHATWQCIELLGSGFLESEQSSIDVEASYEPGRIALTLRYRGTLPIFPDKAPTPEEIAEHPEQVQALSGFLIQQLVGRLDVKRADGACRIRFSFRE